MAQRILDLEVVVTNIDLGEVFCSSLAWKIVIFVFGLWDVGWLQGRIGRQMGGGGVGLDRPALDGAKDVGLGCCRHQHWSLKKY